MSRSSVSYDIPDYDDLSIDRWIPLASRMRLSILHIIGISFSILSFQIAYSVEFALGTPIMNKIDMSSGMKSFLWSTGPISGFFIQPIVGYYSDIYRSKMGRRRPFIIGGSIGIIIGFALLYYVEALGSLFTNYNLWTHVFLVISLIVTNISINIMQGPARAILGDLVPKAQQVTANTIGSVMISFACFIGNLSGGLSLSEYTRGAFTNEQIVIICGVILILFGTVSTGLCGKEEPLTEVPARESPLKEIYHATVNMPRPILRVAIVYFLAWMSYYPYQVLMTDFFANDVFDGNARTHDKPYMDGLAFGMLVMAATSAVAVVYAIFQPKIIERVNMKYVYFITQLFSAISLLLVFFVRNKWALMAILIPLSISLVASNSIPFTVVATCVPQEQMAIYMGVLNFFAVIGQQLAQLIINTGVASFTSNVGQVIGSGSVAALAAAILCFRIETPPSGIEQVDALLQFTSMDPIK